MDFVDNIDLVARFGGGIAHAVEQFTHVVDPGAAGGVQFQHVQVAALDDGPAVTAFNLKVADARFVDGLGFVVQRTREEPSRGGFAHAAHAGQHKSVGDSASGEGVGQGPDHGLLTHQVLETLRPIFPRQDRIGRGRRLASGNQGGRAKDIDSGVVALTGRRLGHSVLVGHGSIGSG